MCDCVVAYFVAVGLVSAVAIGVGAYQLWAACMWLRRVILSQEGGEKTEGREDEKTSSDSLSRITGGTSRPAKR